MNAKIKRSQYLRNKTKEGSGVGSFATMEMILKLEFYPESRLRNKFSSTLFLLKNKTKHNDLQIKHVSEGNKFTASRSGTCLISTSLKNSGQSRLTNSCLTKIWRKDRP